MCKSIKTDDFPTQVPLNIFSGFPMKQQVDFWISEQLIGLPEDNQPLTPLDASRTPKPKRSALKWRGEVGAAKLGQLPQTWVVENPPGCV